jgi:N-acetylglucosaminyldiphosphoundecaprenol N-acetyl-beta-D-mannosaminyltransferase
MTPTHQFHLMGVPLDGLDERRTIETVLEGLSGGSGGWVCPVNLDVLRQCAENPEIRDLVGQADIIVADGMPLIWASRLAGMRLPQRVAGSSLIHTLPEAASTAGRSVFLLGGNPGAAEAAAERLKQDNPELRIAGTLCPPFGFEKDPERRAEVDRALLQTQPDIVFVGLGFPKQDRLIAELRTLVPDAWFVSCGISFSFVSGEVRRAPGLLQRLGLEWLHRLFQEPKRLTRRYLVDGPPFAFAVARSAVHQRLARRRGGAELPNTTRGG